MPYLMKKTANERRILFVSVIVGLVVVGLSLVCYGQCAEAEGGSFTEMASYLGWCILGAALGGLALWGFTKHLS